MNIDDIILFDTETTGLDGPSATNIDKQPFITEFYGIRLTKDFDFVTEYETFIKPPIPIPPEITKITGIDDYTLKDAPTFIDVYDNIYELFYGVRTVAGHNIEFDLRVLKYELFRFDFEYKFNWPKNHICTVEKSYNYKNKRLKLNQLHEYLFGKEFQDAHRAKNDVHANVRCFIEMVKRGDITL